jgi:hypothetical protein
MELKPGAEPSQPLIRSRIKEQGKMRSLDFSRNALTSCVAAAMLAGCGGSQPPIGAPGAMPQTSTTATHADPGSSWMLPEAKSEDLLYISNVYTVTVYSYPQGKLVGTLKHFYLPGGECSDKSGHIFIVDGGLIYEYAHGGKKPIDTLSTSPLGGQGCASDPTTGNLAVALDYGDSYGYLAVYSQAKGTPILYSNGKMLFNFCGYDDSGNLYADGIFEGVGLGFVELSKGGSSLVNLTLDQSLEAAGAVQWDGKYLAIGDDEANKIYRFTVSGSSGTLEDTVTLGGAQQVMGWWIQGKKVIGPGDGPSTVWYWDYPAGGNSIKAITKGVFHPFGATLSVAKK